jgi:hypothetical protein
MPDDIIEDALEQYRFSAEGSAHIRELALEDIKFARLGDQWKDKDRRAREEEGRPCLTVNRLPTFIRRVVNDARQNKPSISVHPVDGGADYDTAQVIGGLIRAIERGSNAALAYDTAIDNAASCGFGFFRITTDYCNHDTFDQEARIERVANPFSVHWDVSSTQFDASDWSFAFVSDLLTDDEFKRRYPKADHASDWREGQGEGMEDWVDDERVRVAEYWTREERKRKILRLTDGRVMRADQMDELVQIGPGLLLPMKDTLAFQGLAVNGEREATYFDVTRRVINAVEVLSEEKWPGTMIPICPVWGEEVIYRGKRHFRSLIRDARDSQVMFNAWRSASTELVMLAPRAPWLVATGSIPPDEVLKWETANTRNHAYLEYDPAMGPMPQRIPFSGVPAGALQEALNAQDDMKAVTGIYDAALGARGNETSGRAIMARQRESDTGTFHFIDNMSRAIQYAGRVLIEIIPSIYSERQTIQILGDDEKQRVERVTAAVGSPPSAEDPDGKIYNLAAGKYDVTVKVGPNYQTQREESVAAMTELMRSYPPAAEALGDLVVQNMDWPGADKASERIQVLQFAKGMEMGLPYQVLAEMMPQAARKFPPPQPPQPQGPPGMPPGMMPQPMQGMPQGMPPGMPPAPMPQG